MIDGSKSVRPQNFELIKQFVNQVVDQLDISDHGTRVGLVQYSSRVRTEFTLSMYKSKEEIKAAVMKVAYMEKGTMTGLALKHMVQNSFSEEEGARAASRNIPRVGLVFTDGRSQDDITEWAKKAKDAGELPKMAKHRDVNQCQFVLISISVVEVIIVGLMFVLCLLSKTCKYMKKLVSMQKHDTSE